MEFIRNSFLVYQVVNSKGHSRIEGNAHQNAAVGSDKMAIRDDQAVRSLDYRCRTKLELGELPFSPGDVTAGSEDELQAVVVGNAAVCDLPITIRDSRLLNIARRSPSGKAPRKTYFELQEFLSDSEGVCEKSWIRFLERLLSPHALNTFLADLKIGKSGQLKRRRSDSVKFTFEQNGDLGANSYQLYVEADAG
jgi:hypothetical protein